MVMFLLTYLDLLFPRIVIQVFLFSQNRVVIFNAPILNGCASCVPSTKILRTASFRFSSTSFTIGADEALVIRVDLILFLFPHDLLLNTQAITGIFCSTAVLTSGKLIPNAPMIATNGESESGSAS
jgi:hypothetical protein